jgi:hypothetical protein
MPISLTADQISKPLLFGRIVQNTSYILQTPEGRAMATAQALGWDAASLFGKPSLPPAAEAQEAEYTATKTTDPEPENKPEDNGNAAALAGEAAGDAGEDDADFPADENEIQQAKKNQFEELSLTLEQYMTSYKDSLNVECKNGVNPYKLAQSEFANKDATVESRSKMIDRVITFLKSKHVPGVA